MSLPELVQDVKQAEAEKRMKADFRVFLWYVWLHVINLPTPTPVQNDMAKYLHSPPSRRFIIQGFRGVAKSFITCAYVVWRLWKDPQLKIMIVSASKVRADANSRFIKKIIEETPFLQHLRAKKGQLDTVIAFDVGPAVPDASPSVKSVGITGQITGSRADIIIADDVEVPGNSSTQGARDKLFELVKEFDAVLKPDGQVIYLGTPQNEMSLYNELLNRGYTTMIWPARYPRDEKQRKNYGTRLAPFIAQVYDDDPDKWAWMPTDPDRFHEQDLRERELSYGKAGFMLQFMLDTSLSDAEKFPLRLKDLIIGSFATDRAPMTFDWLPGAETNLAGLPMLGLRGDGLYRAFKMSADMTSYTGKVLAIDPSGRGKDETGYAVVFFLNGYLFVQEVGGFRGGYDDDTLEKLAKVAKRFKVDDVIIEGNFGDGMYLKLFTPVLMRSWKCSVTEVKSKGQKEVRIADVLEPLFGAHKVIFTEHAIEHDYKTALDQDGVHNPVYSVCHQMTRLTRERGSLGHDDRLDALAMACAFFVESMDRDSEKHRESATQEWLETQMEDAIKDGQLTRRVPAQDGVTVIIDTGADDEWHDRAGEIYTLLTR